MSGAALSAELARYEEMLAPLIDLASDGPATLPPDERAPWEHALATLRGYHGDHLDLEEAVAAFARALWTASGWEEPPARIAEALLIRSKHWRQTERDIALGLATRFAQRAFALNATSPVARSAYARVKLAQGALAEAEKASALLPSESVASAAVRAEIAEARGDRDQAIALRELQVSLEADPKAVRDARNKLGLLYHAAGRVEDAIQAHRRNLEVHPDYSWGHVNLASALEAKGELFEAYRSVESALVLGLGEASPYLDELAAELDRRSLARFKTLLRSGRDGDVIDLCPPAAAGAFA
jgi:tetratricopeptide (TPR) repeat protein